MFCSCNQANLNPPPPTNADAGPGVDEVRVAVDVVHLQHLDDLDGYIERDRDDHLQEVIESCKLRGYPGMTFIF